MSELKIPDFVTNYAKSVVNGEIIAFSLVKKACQRHLDDLNDGYKRGLVFKPEMVAKAIVFFQMLRFPTGEKAGQRFQLEPWQKFLIGSLVGWYKKDEDDGKEYLRFQYAFIELAKSNGKTQLLAGFALYKLIFGEPGSEIYFGAPTRAQATIGYKDLEQLIVACPELHSALTITAHRVTYPDKMSIAKAVSSEGRALDGLRVEFALCDELHEHRNADVVSKLRLGTKNRRNGQVISITNSGWDRNSICYEHHAASEKILNGDIDNDGWFAFITGIDEADGDPLDPKFNEDNWLKANPNLGVSISKAYLRSVVQDARSVPSRRNVALRLCFNKWTENETSWITGEIWDQGNVSLPDLADLADLEWHGGLDLSSVSDITALVLCAEYKDKTLIAPFFWLPQSGATKRSTLDGVPYDYWMREGLMRGIEGSVIDFDVIREDILRISEKYNIKSIRYDRWSATQITKQLSDEGLNMIAFGQGFASMTSPVREMEKRALGGQLIHAGHPVLRWMAGNCVAVTDSQNNVKLDKKRSKEKIDGMVCLAMALAGIMSNEETQVEDDINDFLLNPIRLF
jgi:phage terminase large subunit-like protein